MRLGDIMQPITVTLHPEQSVQDVAELFIQYHLDCALVTDEGGAIKGVLTCRQVMKSLKGRANEAFLVKELMYDDIRSGAPNDKVQDYSEKDLKYLPVLEDGKIVGLVTHKNVGKAFFKLYHKVSNRLDAVINSTHNLIVAVDMQGRIELFNRAQEEFFGLKASDVIGMDVKDLVPTSGLADILQSGKTEPVQKVSIHGHTFISNRSPIKDDDDVIIGAVAVLQDISELESIAAELEHYKNLNNELDKIIEFSFDGMFITDGNGLALRANEAFERITGNRRQDVLGRGMKELEQAGIVNKSVTTLVLEQKQAVTIIQESLNGHITLTSGNPVFDESGNIFRVVTNVRDLTELEELKKKLEEVEDLSQHYQSELRTLRMQYIGSDKIVTNSAKMQEIVKTAVRLASFDSTILITGESGTGKELIAELMHDNSERKHGPFIKVNCGAIPENLLESELFGYDYGAFTGAKKSGRSGYFQMANEGTIFLDEIGDLPYNLQVKILRVLQHREIVRVGGEKSVPIDVRVITATNRNLLEMVEQKQFREDLFYRLNVVPVVIPPLRERKEDIPALLKHFTRIFNKKHRLFKTFSPEVLENFIDYDWPGNVRELQNLVENLLVTSLEAVISRKDLPSYLSGNINNTEVFISKLIPLQNAIDILEKQLIEKAYTQYPTTRQMAKALNVSAATIVRKAAKYGISK
ncbi:MAG TPA: sigma 54-interacting transcriptional regulator [Bacillota bacterium]|nr:sigma 54-interacting transcriptional regulator [Bacillota bacterium]